MPSHCIFELNKENCIYFSGEQITGTVFLSTTSDKSVRDISILFVGEGKVKWQESSSTTDSNGRSSTHTTYYKSHEVYINSSTYIQGEGNLPAGRHAYTFNITLPLECPTSCEGKYGYIRYELSLTLNRFYRFNNVFKKPLTVIRTIDLNLNPAFRMPLAMECIKNVCWPCSRGQILYTLIIPFGGYAPGQAVKYSLHIQNQSTSDVDGYDLKFCKTITFTAKSPRRKQRFVKELLVEHSYPDKCLRLTNSVLNGEFIIPATPPSTNRDCIICVEYKIKLTARVYGCNDNSELKIPLFIGTIPIRESLQASQYLSNSQREQIVSTAPEVQSGSDPNYCNDLPLNYDELKPPSYEQATGSSVPFIDTDIDERNRIVGFRPLYPIYKM